VIEQLVRILVDAGADPVAAARAAVVLDAGGSVAEAARVIDVASEPTEFDPDLLILEALLTQQHARELAEVRT